MLLYKNHQANTTFMPKIVQHNESGWSYIYDKYAPIMYGTILKMTGDEDIVEDILEEVFVELYTKKLLAPDHTALCHSLLRHTFKSTIKHLEAKGKKVQQTFNEHYPIINLFYFEQVTVKEAAKKSGLPEQEVLQSLRTEFNHFCHHNK